MTPLTSLFTTPRSKPARRLSELGARRRELFTEERDALASLEAAQVEHTRLAKVVVDDEAKALALGTKPQVNAQGKLTKLARQVEEHHAASDRLARAIVALDEEVRHIAMINADELISEAVTSHEAARERIGQLVTELREQQAVLRGMYVASQAVFNSVGLARLTDRLRIAPDVETLVRDGGAEPLLRKDDRHSVSYALHGERDDTFERERKWRDTQRKQAA
jgi:hypothetical protein